MSDLEWYAEETVKWIKSLSKEEEEVFDILIDYLDTLPPGFFEKNSVEELNKHFGGHDDMMVTEKVRRALDAQQKMELILDEMAEIYDDLPEEDEDAYEEEDN